MADRTVKVSLVASVAGFQTAVGKAAESTDNLRDKAERFSKGRYEATLDVDVKKAETKIGAFATNLQKRISGAIKSLPAIDITADSSAADRRIAAIRSELASLSNKRIGIDIDASAATQRVNALQRELAGLSNKSLNVQVRADTAAASAALAGVNRQVSTLNGRQANVSVQAQNVDRAIGLMALLTAGISAAGFAAVGAAGAIAAIPAAVGVAAQGIGTLAAGFSGVGDAVKALGDAETKAAGASSAAASTRQAALERVASAQRGLAQAQTQFDRAAITGARQVAQAQEAVGDAQRDAARQVASATRNLEQAQRSALSAQQSLTRARADETERLEDLGLALRDGALAQDEAALSLRRAQEALAEGIAAGAAGDELVELELAVRRAALGVDRAKESFGDLDAEATKAARNGIEGSEGVVAAQRQVQDSARQVADAEAALAQARTDGARDVARAQQALGEAQQQAMWAQQDAARQVADAQRQVSEALAATSAAAGGASAGVDKVAEAMAKLSPAGRDFAHFLNDEMLPALRGIRDSIQGELLPGVQAGMRNMLVLAPLLSDKLGETGRIFGDLAVKGSELMTSGPFQTDLGTIMDSNNRALEDFGTAGLSLMDAFTGISAEAGPMIERFSQATEKASATFATFVTGARQSGEMTDFFVAAGDILAELGETFGQVAVGVGKLAVALGPLGGVLLDAIGNVAEMIGNFAEANPTITQFIAGAVLATSTIVNLGRGIGGLAAVFATTSGGLKTLGGAAAALMPAALATNLTSRFSAVAIGAGTLTERFTGSAKAGEKVMTSGGKVAGAMGKLAAGVPLAGAALIGFKLAADALTISTDDAAEAILGGGEAADQARLQIEKQSGAVGENLGWTDRLNQSVNDWIGNQTGLWATTDTTNQKIREQTAAMSPLQLAQQDVTYWTNEHDQAVKRFGENSPQAIVAAGELATAVNNVETEQAAAKRATEDHTEALIRQRDEMLGSLSADIAYETSKARVAEAQRILNEKIAEYGVDSPEAAAAARDLNSAYVQAVTDAGAAAGAANAHKTATEQDKAAVFAQNQELIRLAGIAGDDLPPQLQKMIGKIDASSWAAAGAKADTDEFGHAVAVLPNGKTVRIDADTHQALTDLQHYVDVLNDVTRPRTVLIQGKYAAPTMGNEGTPTRWVGGGATGALVHAMADGGVMSNRFAQIVPPNTPRLIGDRVRGDEFFIPDNDDPKSVAIGMEWMRRRGFLAMAAGGVLGATSRAASLAGTGTEPGTVPMDPKAVEDLAASVQKLTADALQPLSAELAGVTTPALAALHESLPPLAAANVEQGAVIRDAWAQNSAAVVALQGQHNASWADMQTQQGAQVGVITQAHVPALSAGLQFAQDRTTQTQVASNASWTDMQAQTGANVGVDTSRHFPALSAGLQFTQDRTTATQLASNAAWTNMQQTTGAQVATITGPIFGGLLAGMSGVQVATGNMAESIRTTWERIRAYTGDPIRYAIDFPINEGMVKAWNEIDRQFALGKPMARITPGFARGGIVPGWSPGRDNQLTPTSGGEAVMRPEWTAAVGPDYVQGANAAARAGGALGVQRYQREHFRALQSGRMVEGADHEGPGISSTGFGGVKPWVARTGHYIRQRFGVGTIGGVGSRSNASDHPSGHALDFMTYQNSSLGDRVAGYLQQNAAHFAVKYLIWKQRINEGSGWRGMEDRGSVTANHYDHVHASFLRSADGGRTFSGAGADFIDPVAVMNEKMAGARRMAAEITQRFGIGFISTAAQKMTTDAIDGAIKFGSERMFASVDPGGAGVERWRPMVHRALAIAGEPQGHDNITLRRMNQESGGNPTIVNRNDINWSRGTPSVGLMQVIGPTYRAHKHPQHDVGPYSYGTSVNPLANTLASMRYALSRYGSLPSAYNRAGGYDTGGILGHGQVGVNLSGRPERILNPDQTRAFERLVDVISTRQGSPSIPRAVQVPAGVAAGGAGSMEPRGGDTINIVTTPQATAPQIMQAVVHQHRVSRLGGVRRG